MCGFSGEEADHHHGHGNREPTKEDLTRIECTLAQKCLRFSSTRLKDLDLDLSPIGIGHPNRTVLDASLRLTEDTPVHDAVDKLLHAAPGSIAVIVSSPTLGTSSVEKGVVSFEALFRAAFRDRD